MINTSLKYLSRYQALLKFPNLIALKGIYRILQSNFEDLRKIIEDKKSYAGISIFIPSEILNALNIHYLALEPVIATAFQLNIVRDLKDIQNEILIFDTSCCGSQSVLSLYKRKILPPPKYLLACSHMCDDSLKTFNFVSRYYNIPIFNIDVPYYNDEYTLDYIAAQLKDFIDFLCKIEKKTFKISSLKETISISNRTNELRHKIFSSCMKNPPIFKMSEYLPIYPLYTKFGKKDVEEIYIELLKETNNRIENKNQVFQDNYYRIFWMGMIPLASINFWKFIDSLHFGFPITELLLNSDFETIDEKDPIRGIARKLMSYPLVGGTQKRINLITNVIDNYGIEGVIHFNHRGCVSFNGDNFALYDYFKKRNIPFLVLEGDISDHDILERSQEKILNFHNILRENYGEKLSNKTL